MCLGPHRKSLQTAEILDADFRVVGYRALAIDPVAAAEASRILAGACAPAPNATLAKGMAKARISCKRRGEDEFGEEALQSVYLETLQRYPADVAMHVCGRMHTLEGGWWPCLKAVEDELNYWGRARMELRRAMAECAERTEDGPGTPHASPAEAPRKRFPSSRARIDAIAAEMASMGLKMASVSDEERARVIDEIEQRLFGETGG